MFASQPYVVCSPALPHRPRQSSSESLSFMLFLAGSKQVQDWSRRHFLGLSWLCLVNATAFLQDNKARP